MSFPGALPSFAGFIAGHTLAADSHAAQHNLEQTEVVAIATKLGTGASTPVNNRLLRGNGIGTSQWAQADLTGDVTGVLPVANGGLGQNSLTNLPLTSPSISGTVSGGATYTTPTLTTPAISDFTSATHTHADNPRGGQLNAGNALLPSTLPYNILTTDSTWAWQTFNPNWINLTVGNGIVTAFYAQIGKSVIVHIGFVMGSSSVMAASPQFVFPVVANARYGIGNTSPGLGTVYFEDLLINGYNGTFRASTITRCDVVLYTASAAYVQSSGINATTPFTWGTGDFFNGTLIYEAG